jgi:hypothetical protein
MKRMNKLLLIISFSILIIYIICENLLYLCHLRAV